MEFTEEELLERAEFIKSVLEGADAMSDRSIVITTAAGLEDCTIKILWAHLNNECKFKELFSGPTAPLGTFSSRIMICLSLGLISKQEADGLNLVRSVRNKFAHEIDASFENEKVINLCKKSPSLGNRMIWRDEFHHLGLNLITQLAYRDLEIQRLDETIGRAPVRR